MMRAGLAWTSADVTDLPCYECLCSCWLHPAEGVGKMLPRPVSGTRWQSPSGADSG